MQNMQSLRILKISALVMLVSFLALVAIGSPAFATPNITASSGTRAVSPFLTPIGNTRSQSTAVSTNSSYAITGVLTLSCAIAKASGYVTGTHTQVRLTSLAFGDGRPGSCTTGPSITLDGNYFSCTATSADPWFLHAKTFDGRDSTTGTSNNPSTCSYKFTLGGFNNSCIASVDTNQSYSATYTQRATSLSVTGRAVLTIRPIGATCGATGSFNAMFTGDFTFRPDTPRDTRVTVTRTS
jgi:hypothetical protein